MINSIKYFEEECISKFEKLEDDFIKLKLNDDGTIVKVSKEFIAKKLDA